jgi:hypothetical protein
MRLAGILATGVSLAVLASSLAFAGPTFMFRIDGGVVTGTTPGGETDDDDTPPGGGGQNEDDLPPGGGGQAEDAPQLVIAPQTGLLPGSVAYSTPAVYKGPTLPADVDMGEIRVCASSDCTDMGATGWTTSVTVVEDSWVQVRNETPHIPDATGVTTVTIGAGELVVEFLASTSADLPTLAAFSDTIAAPQTTASSDLAEFRGAIDAMITIEEGEYRVCSTDGSCSPFTSSDGTIDDGESLQLRTTAPSTSNTSKTMTVMAGIAASEWTIMTPEDVDPDAFQFVSATGVAPFIPSESNVVAIEGHSGVTVSATGDYQVCAAPDCSDQTVWRTAPTAGVVEGTFARVRATPATYGASASTTLTAGSRSSTYGATARVKDETPDDFSFTATSEASPAQEYFSSVATLTGHDGVGISVSGHPSAFYRICADAGCSGTAGWTQTDSVAQSGASIQLRMVPTQLSTTTPVVLTAGTSSATWSLTTRAGITTPATFTIAPESGVEPAVATTSAIVTPSGIEGDVTVSVSGGTNSAVSVDGGSSWATSAVLPAGGSFRVRQTSAGFGGFTTASVVVGTGTPVGWTVTTRAQRTTGNSFSIPARNGVERGETVDSAPVVPSGFEGPVTVATSAGMVSTDGGATYSTTAVLPKDGSFTLRTTASSSFSTPVDVTVTAGTNAAATWTVTTRAKDTVPDDFVLTNLSGVSPGTQVSDIVRLVGHDGVDVSISGHPSVAYQICFDAACTSSGTWTNQPTSNLASGSWVRVRASPSGYAETAEARFSTGSTTTTWSVTTRAAATSPASFTIDPKSGVEPATPVVSASITPAGLETAVSVTVSGGTGAGVSVDDGATWAASRTLSAGGSFLVRQTSSAFGLQAVATVVAPQATPSRSHREAMPNAAKRYTPPSLLRPVSKGRSPSRRHRDRSPSIPDTATPQARSSRRTAASC